MELRLQYPPTCEYMPDHAVIELPSGTFANPIGKAFKRVDLGETENLPYFYQVFTNRP